MLFFSVMPLGFADQLEYLVDEKLPMAILFAAYSGFVQRVINFRCFSRVV